MCDSCSTLPAQAVDRAVRLSCIQAMLGAVYVASTGGMFLIGYALKLGASDVQIGYMSTIPMMCVLAQLPAALAVERGYSRRRMTVLAALANALGWAAIILIPYVFAAASAGLRIGLLIATITLVTLFGQVSGNARASWIGDLIPADRRGNFFGRLTRYGGFIATAFALIEGVFLDRVKGAGIGAFGVLFGFGMIFGLANALLFLPQADVPVAPPRDAPGLGQRIVQTLRNGPLMALLAYVLLWSMQSVAGPFYATYMLRDMKMPFFGVGLLNAAVMVTMLISSPFWGRIIDRYGCRPVLIACTACVAPVPLVWMFLHSPAAIYSVIVPVNLAQGFAIGGVIVAMNTLVYKVTPSAGRAVQLAVYSIIILLVAAPMPTIGGSLPQWLAALGIQTDLRCTFYASSLFLGAAALAARYLRENGSRRTRDLVRNLPGHVAAPGDLARAA